MPLPENIEARSEEEWLSLAMATGDKVKRRQIHEVMLGLGYSATDFLDMTPKERVKIIMKNQESEGGTEKKKTLLKTGNGLGSKSGLGGSKTLASTTTAPGKKLGLGSLGLKKAQAAEEPEDDEEEEAAPATKASKLNGKGPAGGTEVAILKALEDIKGMVLELATKVQSLEETSAELAEVKALAKEVHFATRIFLELNEDFKGHFLDDDAQGNLYGQLVLEGKE